MKRSSTVSAILWAANVVVWGCVYILDRNSKSEKARIAEQKPGEIKIDFSGSEPLSVNYDKKMIPEFTIYQV